MNKEQQEIEIEARLRAMRPAEPSPNLHRRIADTLAEHRSEKPGASLFLPRLWVGLASAAVIGIAGLVGVILLHEPTQPPRVVISPQAVPEIKPAVANDPAVLTPTLLALNTAYRESPSRFDQLLDRISADRLVQMSGDVTPIPTASTALSPDFYQDLP